MLPKSRALVLLLWLWLWLLWFALTTVDAFAFVKWTFVTRPVVPVREFFIDSMLSAEADDAEPEGCGKVSKNELIEIGTEIGTEILKTNRELISDTLSDAGGKLLTTHRELISDTLSEAGSKFVKANENKLIDIGTGILKKNEEKLINIGTEILKKNEKRLIDILSEAGGKLLTTHKKKLIDILKTPVIWLLVGSLVVGIVINEIVQAGGVVGIVRFHAARARR